MEYEKMMPFGEKVSVGNFYVVKITKSLSAKEQKSLREANGVPADLRKRLTRGGLPYIVVNSVSGGWSISFVAGSTMYNFIEHEYLQGEDGIVNLHRLFTMMYADTAILGDPEYLAAKGEALKAYMERQKAAEDDGGEALEDVMKDEEQRAVMREMAEEIMKDEEHGHDNEH